MATSRAPQTADTAPDLTMSDVAMSDVTASEFDAVPGFVADPLTVSEREAEAEGWIPAQDLVSGERLDDLFAMPQRLWRAPEHAAAVLAWKTYTYRLAQPLAAAWTLAREIPLSSADNVLVQVLPAAPYITVGLRRSTSAVLPTSPATRSHDAIVLPDEATQLAFLRSTLIDQHLRPLMECTRQTRRIGERVLWGQAAAAIAYAFADISATAALDTTRFTELLPVQGLAGVGEDDTVWRNTCCLAFASPALTACRDCVTVVRARRSLGRRGERGERTAGDQRPTLAKALGRVRGR
jgi:Ferric iron reductase FhuF-like transporter